jgi:hypothetical protein
MYNQELEKFEKIAVNIKNIKQEKKEPEKTERTERKVIKADRLERNVIKTDRSEESFISLCFPKVINSSNGVINDKLAMISKVCQSLTKKEIVDKFLRLFIHKNIAQILDYLVTITKEFDHLLYNYKKYYKINNLLHRLMSELVTKHEVCLS